MSVLLVDDTPINRAVLRRTLEAVGASVVEAHDGLAAYELYRSCGGSQTFSLVLMDLCMPVCDGWTATSYIRALERAAGWPAAPVIACTSECVDLGTLALQRCWEVGMDGVVGKALTCDMASELLQRFCDVPASCRLSSGSDTGTNCSLADPPASTSSTATSGANHGATLLPSSPRSSMESEGGCLPDRLFTTLSSSLCGGCRNQ